MDDADTQKEREITVRTIIKATEMLVAWSGDGDRGHSKLNMRRAKYLTHARDVLAEIWNCEDGHGLFGKASE